MSASPSTSDIQRLIPPDSFLAPGTVVGASDSTANTPSPDQRRHIIIAAAVAPNGYPGQRDQTYCWALSLAAAHYSAPALARSQRSRDI